MTTIKPFLMFIGKAEEAINLYTSLFDQSEVISMNKYTNEVPGMEGQVMYSEIIIHDLTISVIDSADVHAFTFTPSTSLFVEFDSLGEFDRVYQGLLEGGSILMPLDTYPFSDKYAWLSDRFGVSWQLSLHKVKY